jgi:hypothetical protein
MNAICQTQPHPEWVPSTLTHQWRQLNAQLNELDVEALARQSGFSKRAARKAPVRTWLSALVALAAESVPSLERLAALLGLTARTAYSKQAVHKRVRAGVEPFLAAVATTLLGRLGEPLRVRGLFGHFRRVLLHDSTCLPLPAHLAAEFPGSRNQRRKTGAGLKIQFVCDLLHSRVAHLSLSGFTRNDQAAAPDILGMVRPGDLIIRDLGYFVLTVFQSLDRLGAYFLSRLRHGIGLRLAESGLPLDLARHLKACGHFDGEVLLGEQRVRVRLVAQPVPEAVANQRRRQASSNRDRRHPPSPERLLLLGWNIFITNVPRQVWPPQALAELYRLRWRIEVIFKAWKSHLGLCRINRRTAPMVRLSVMAKLLFCLLVCRCCNHLELLCGGKRHVSLLRLARIIGECACLFAAALVRLSPQAFLLHQLQHHLFYEQRADRKNFYEMLNHISSLG